MWHIAMPVAGAVHSIKNGRSAYRDAVYIIAAAAIDIAARGPRPEAPAGTPGGDP